MSSRAEQDERPTTRHPPKPRLALHVGVTGHRPGRLPEDTHLLEEKVAAVLTSIAGIFAAIATSNEAKAAFDDSEAPVLRLLSPLAEGADRIAAEAALAVSLPAAPALKYELQCPLPFSREVYAEDFAPTQNHPEDTREAFYALLKHERVSCTLELDGSRETKAKQRRAYSNVGRLILRHSDILLALWDGVEEDDSPGTAGIVFEAKKQRMPVICINTHAPHAATFFLPGENQSDSPDKWPPLSEALLSPLLARTLLPPNLFSNTKTPHDRRHHHGASVGLRKCFGTQENSRLAYFNQPLPCRGGLGWVYRGFLSVFGDRCLCGKSPSYSAAAAEQWSAMDSALSSLGAEAAQLRSALGRGTKKHFLQADGLAAQYSDEYRSTFILSFAMGSLAVLFALLSGPFEGRTSDIWDSFAYAELISIIMIVFLIARGVICDLHQRWLDFRLLAERLRQHVFLKPIGGTSFLAMPTYESRSDNSYAWVEWLVRALGRAEGIPTLNFNASYRQGYARFLAICVGNQANYHYRTAERYWRITACLHNFNWLLLGLIISACFIHIFSHSNGWPIYATIAAAVFPAFGAAVAGVLGQGEFERIAARSADMAEELKRIADVLKEAVDVGQDLSAEVLEKQASEAIEVMNQELSDWRVIFRAKTLDIHA